MLGKSYPHGLRSQLDSALGIQLIKVLWPSALSSEKVRHMKTRDILSFSSRYTINSECVHSALHITQHWCLLHENAQISPD